MAGIEGSVGVNGRIIRGVSLAVVVALTGCSASPEGQEPAADASFGTIADVGSDGNLAPTGTITSPADGQVVQYGDPVSFAAVISDDTPRFFCLAACRM